MRNPRMAPEGLAPYHHEPGPRSRVSGMQVYLIAFAVLAVFAVGIASVIRDFF